jgi:hypothetical protein
VHPAATGDSAGSGRSLRWATLHGHDAAAARTGERVSTSTTHEAAGRGLADLTTGVVRHSSAQASRRAVLHVQAPGDSSAPADLAGWFTERGFHFYVAGVRLPIRAALTTRHARRDLQSAFTDLDTAARRLRRDDGVASVIVTARGRAAVAAALWSASGPASTAGGHSDPRGDGDPQGDSDPQGDTCLARADALILWAPAWPTRGGLQLDIGCPVLVIGDRVDAGAGGAPRARWPRARWRRARWRRARWRRARRSGPPGPPALQLGSHVTWLALADADTDQRQFLTELGRWLGAYMYGSVLDQLL